ncbi:MAG: hypothetical protein OEZ68_12730 [Gammaproteobacteria bacterium]|nr:hypothetical protein [Gammaproteobacteria bacterium]MDH5801662.1 hypothetical protein [Gammaproteobacteria bacterium]
METQFRYFQHPGLYAEQQQSYASIAVEPQYTQQWDNGKYSFGFTPFVRYDRHDEERSHADVRELTWLGVYADWELRVGIRKVFWGVTESQHLVDVINQTDFLENPDGEDKLGQPMINASFVSDLGIVDVYVLTGFRQRTFAAKDGRPRTPVVVDTSGSTYESSQEDRHVDYAVRWHHSVDVWDIGLSQFYGTNREPTLTPGLNPQGEPVLIPHYALMSQTGMDVQATMDNWLLKLEWISRDSTNRRHTALTGGFEYTFVGILESAVDVGVISEYLFDDRGDAAVFNNHLMVGSRIAFNDAQSTDLLAGVILDLDNKGRMFSLEGSRRLGDSWKLNLEARVFSGLDVRSLLYPWRDDDFLQLSLGWFF